MDWSKAPCLGSDLMSYAPRLADAYRQAGRQGETVDGEFTTAEEVAEATLYFAAARTSALTGQPRIVSHGWVME